MAELALEKEWRIPWLLPGEHRSEPMEGVEMFVETVPRIVPGGGVSNEKGPVTGLRQQQLPGRLSQGPFRVGAFHQPRPGALVKSPG